MKNLKDNSILLEESSVTTAEVPNNVNISKYVEMIQEYILRKNNVLNTATYNNGTKRPELVLASRLSENPISVIDRTSDSIYRIKIERYDKVKSNKNSINIVSDINSDKVLIPNNVDQSPQSEIHLYITLNDTNDVLRLKHSIVYHLDTIEDKLFMQLIPGVFINLIY